MQQGFGEQNLSAESFRMAWAWGSAAEQQALGCPLLDSGSGRFFHAPRVLAICVPVLHALPIHTWDLGTVTLDIQHLFKINTHINTNILSVSVQNSKH